MKFITGGAGTLCLLTLLVQQSSSYAQQALSPTTSPAPSISCQDNPDKFFVSGTSGNEMRTCDWVNRRTSVTLKSSYYPWRCEAYPEAAANCRSSCGLCDSGPTTTPQPSPSPSAAASCEYNDASNYRLPQVGPVTTFPPPVVHTLLTVTGLQAVWVKEIKKFETPITVRFTHLIDILNWNCAAIYSSEWKDALTKGDAYFHTPGSIEVMDNTTGILENVPLHVSDTRFLCMVNAWATVVKDWIPEATSDLLGHIENFLYPDIQPGWSDDVDGCFNLQDGTADIPCLKDVAQRSCFTPSIIGSIVGRQVNEYAKRDGWNMYGDLNSDGTECKSNCRRYIDPTSSSTKGKKEQQFLRSLNIFKSKNADKEQKKNQYDEEQKKNQWKPLLEDNGRGYFVRQEHVTPHIGLTAKTRLLTRQEFDARNLQDPDYDYDMEARLVMERMSTLNTTEKLKVEIFDDKIETIFAVILAVFMQGMTFEQLLNFNVGVTSVEYETILLAWKEKVKHDLIRPTTWIQENLGNERFVTWAGPMAGIKEIPGKNFEAYKRVMPHSEYVSGSACLCQGLYEFTDSWLSSNLNLNNSVAVEFKVEKHSSIVEPGIPDEDMTLKFDNMLAVRNACGESRLKGGMHFSKSVPDAYELCKGVGLLGNEYATSLWG